jgi:hypothetical protein
MFPPKPVANILNIDEIRAVLQTLNDSVLAHCREEGVSDRKARGIAHSVARDVIQAHPWLRIITAADPDYHKTNPP